MKTVPNVSTIDTVRILLKTIVVILSVKCDEFQGFHLPSRPNEMKVCSGVLAPLV